LKEKFRSRSEFIPTPQKEKCAKIYFKTKVIFISFLAISLNISCEKQIIQAKAENSV
jgi:hypothetical protein